MFIPRPCLRWLHWRSGLYWVTRVYGSGVWGAGGGGTAGGRMGYGKTSTAIGLISLDADRPQRQPQRRPGPVGVGGAHGCPPPPHRPPFPFWRRGGGGGWQCYRSED